MPCELWRHLLGHFFILGEREDDADGRFAWWGAARQRRFTPVFAERRHIAGHDSLLGTIHGPFAAERHRAAPFVVGSAHERFTLDRPHDCFRVGFFASQMDVDLADFLLIPHRRFAARVVEQVETGDSHLNEFRKRFRHPRFGVRIGELVEFLLRQPEMVAAGLISFALGADGLLQAEIGFLHQSSEDFERLCSLRHGAIELFVGFRIVFHLHRARFAAISRELLPFTKRLLDGIERGLGVLTGVLVREEFAVRRQAINALAGRTPFALSRTLVGHAAEKPPLGVLAAALVPVVGDDRDEVVFDDLLNVVIGEGERTARDSVVSGAAERVPVHLP